TCTVLPAWSLPYTHYSVQTRQRSSERCCAGVPIEQAAPVLFDAGRIPDVCTLRAWFQQRISGVCVWLKLISPMLIFQPPTILVWNWKAALHIGCATQTGQSALLLFLPSCF